MSSITHCDYCDAEKHSPDAGGWTVLRADTAYYEGGAALVAVHFDLCRDCTLRVDDLRTMLKRGLSAAPNR